MPRAKPLTITERGQIVSMAAQGLPMAEIARELGRSTRTVHDVIKESRIDGQNYNPERVDWGQVGRLMEVRLAKCFDGLFDTLENFIAITKDEAWVKQNPNGSVAIAEFVAERLERVANLIGNNPK